MLPLSGFQEATESLLHIINAFAKPSLTHLGFLKYIEVSQTVAP